MDIGHVVVLNSSGPRMTIVNITEYGRERTCVWFDKDQNIRSGNFPLNALRYFIEDKKKVVKKKVTKKKVVKKKVKKVKK